VLDELGLERGGYYLATIHRPQNADDPVALGAIMDALIALDATVVLPLHPRTRTRLADHDEIAARIRGSRVCLTTPRGYLDMLMLEQFARAILTDSGGVQKEAYFFGVPCVTLRAETEWTETVESGWNVLVGTSKEAIASAASAAKPPATGSPLLFGDGHAATKIAELLPTIQLL
jgi:UDP-GlcNAc3NAcA epimerase